MAMKNKKAFTLVELLAVIVILAVILVIAVPQIMNVITESRKGALASSAKLIASSAETAYISNQTLGIEKDIECEDVSSYNSNDDFTCDLKIEDGKAKVTLIGKGKFEGMAVCGGTKDDAIVKMKKSCPPAPVSFSTDSWETIADAVKDGNTLKYNVGDTKTINLGTALGTHTVRIANMSACPTGANALASETACGFVLEFSDIIAEQQMNTTKTGGWPNSTLYLYVKETIYNALPEDLRNAIIPTTVVSGQEYGKAENYTTIDKLYLLSPEEVYGTSFTDSNDAALGTSRQLDYYANYVNKNGTIGVTTSKGDGAIKKNSSDSALFWWFRLANHSSGSRGWFFGAGSDGKSQNKEANTTYGISPAFRLG